MKGGCRESAVRKSLRSRVIPSVWEPVISCFVTGSDSLVFLRQLVERAVNQ